MPIISESGSLEGYTPEDLIPEASTPDFEYTAPIWEDEIPGSASDPFEGTSFSGVFRTSDDRETSTSFGFITIGRDGPSTAHPIAHYYNGYGIAIRPSEDSSVHNVFVVDNALAVPSVVLEDVIHTGWGDMAYLASTHVDIEPDTDYNFRMDIGEGYTIRFWVWETSTGAMPVAPTLTYGSYQPVSDGRYFGVSCSMTDGYQWQWDNLYISFTDDKYAVQYFNFDGDGFVDDFKVKAYAYGYGYDGSSPLPEYGILMFAWNYTTLEWDELDSHTNGPGGEYADILLESDDLDVSDYVGSPSSASLDTVSTELERMRVLLVSKYPSDLDEGVDSGVVTDYIYLENWDVENAHVGGMGDSYIKDGSQPVQTYIDIENITAEEWLLSTNTSISGTLTLPVMWIENIELLDASGNPSGYFAQPITDYELIVYAEDYRYSTKEQNYLVFKNLLGSDVRVRYWTYTVMSQIQDYMDTDLRRNVTDDYLAKLFTPAELFMELTVDGSMAATDMIDLLSKWINGSTRTTLTSSDIATYLNSQSTINDTTVDSLSVIVRHPSGDTTVHTGDLSLDEREAFVLVPNARHITITAG